MNNEQKIKSKKITAMKLALKQMMIDWKLSNVHLDKSSLIKPSKPYKFIYLDMCDIKPDISAEWRKQGETSYANEFTNYEIEQ